jgi:hypothetical protein
MNEAQIISEVIIPVLDENDWNSHNLFYYKEISRLAPQFAGFLLMGGSKRIGVIKVEKPGSDLNLAVLQAMSFAANLNNDNGYSSPKLIYATDGTDYVQFNMETNTSEKIVGIPAVWDLNWDELND